MSLLPLWALNLVVVLLSMEVRKLSDFIKNIFICVEDERRSLLFLKYWLWGANLSLLLKSYICSLFFHSSCCCIYYTAVQTNVRYTGFHCQPCAVHFSSQGCDSAGGPIATVAEWLQCCGLMRASEELQVVCCSRCHCHQFLPACTGYLKWILNAPLPYRANYFNFFIHKTITLHHRILQISSCFYYLASEGNNISTLSVGTGLLISYLSGKASVGLWGQK